MEGKTLAFLGLAAFILAFTQTGAESIFSGLRNKRQIVPKPVFACNISSISLALVSTTPVSNVNTYPLNPKTDPVCQGKDSGTDCCVNGLVTAGSTGSFDPNIQNIVAGVASICVSPCNSDNSTCNVQITACGLVVQTQTLSGKCVSGGCQLASADLQVLAQLSKVTLSLNEIDCKKNP